MHRQAEASRRGGRAVLAPRGAGRARRQRRQLLVCRVGRVTHQREYSSESHKGTSRSCRMSARRRTGMSASRATAGLLSVAAGRTGAGDRSCDARPLASLSRRKEGSKRGQGRGTSRVSLRGADVLEQKREDEGMDSRRGKNEKGGYTGRARGRSRALTAASERCCSHRPSRSAPATQWCGRGC